MDLSTATTPQLRERANRIRRGPVEDPHWAFKLAKRLAALQWMEEARLLAQHIRDDRRFTLPEQIEVRQKEALWTSKNPDGPDDSKHDDALAILAGIGALAGGQGLAQTTDAETLGIAGGIWKRKWAIDGQRTSLEESLRFYERGAAQGIVRDNGYTAINAAFVSDLLAHLEAAPVPTAQARALRERVLAELLPVEEQPAYAEGPRRGDLRWFHETIAEAHFGLGQYEQAGARLRRIDWSRVDAWEVETTARQFAWLARLQDPQAGTPEDFQRSPAWRVLRECFGKDPTRGAASLFAGKLGVALSGGGFRASFFHIGVLAALAELDMLRHVEVLSCVSGGSILGAHYYLEVRKLLQERADGDITRAQYIELVERLARDFLAGVQQNIRTRAAANLRASLKMMLWPGYSRTNRLGELYEECLFARVQDQDAHGVQERRLRNLTVRPKDDEDCQPKYDNWRRTDKVPILILNAATLNTGHNWQFTATWMGEPASQIESRVDGNYRLRRMYLENEAPPAHRDIHIGQAVAASSCVPGLFTPLELRNLYPDITVRLVDGGVHDNQGVFGLLEQNCTVFIVSDASGQMSAIAQPTDATFPVLARSSSMAMARVRATEYRELESRQRSGRIKGLLFLHLKRELPVRDVDWVECDNPRQLTAEELRRDREELTSYGILKRVQEQIAGIRTDLDSFSDAEAYALMTSGCKMVRVQFAPAIQGFPTSALRHDWEFLRIADALDHKAGPEPTRMARLLAVANQTGFKIWHLVPALRWTALGLAIAVACGLLWTAWSLRDAPGASVARGIIGVVIVAAVLGALLRAVRYRKTVHQIALGAALTTLGGAAAWIHLRVFDPWFLARGRIGPPPGPTAARVPPGGTDAGESTR